MEPNGAFVERELDDVVMLTFPTKNQGWYADTVKEKVDRVRQEVRDNAVICDRRRFSMLREGVLSPELFLCGLTDFILTIAETYQEKFRKALEMILLRE